MIKEGFIKKCGTFYIATIDGDKPRVRPFGVVNVFNDKLYIQTGKIKKVSKQMQINPNVEICCFSDGKWLRVEGVVKRDDSRDAKLSMLDANPMLKNMYSVDDDNTEVLYFTKAKAIFYSFTEEARTIEF